MNKRNELKVMPAHIITEELNDQISNVVPDKEDFLIRESIRILARILLSAQMSEMNRVKVVNLSLPPKNEAA
ncbi:hypothetical protein [Chitinophaga rhizophila]|uniref:Uncharacterized protein n=1 Tax=Chitinophaga rhizophila TaxID=2866212 RepID=A0ABS7GCY9_9BACT|nr:hypothetical protein [Chitinophaga rhizophila]MBW8685201.1 hypothetical protein [Chitinophaga rhizophila]